MVCAFLLLIIVSISLCEALGQSCLKYFNMNSDQPQYYLFALLFYAAICYLLVKSYNYRGMGVVNAVWSGLSVFAVLMSGILFFGEKIAVSDLIGAVSIVFGVFMILKD